jgi:hypothetical protein
MEWGPPELRSPYMAATMCLAAAVVVTWSRFAQRVSWVHIGMLVIGVGWSLLYARTVALGAVMLAPLAASAIQSLLPRHPSSGRRDRLGLSLSIAGCLLLGAMVAPTTAREPGGVPNDLDRKLGALPAGTVIFNEYHLGGWLLWRHKELEPVIDPRTEIYGPEYMDRYLRARSAAPGWQTMVSTSGATAALLPSDSPLGEALRRELGWTQIGSDEGFDLWTAR